MSLTKVAIFAIGYVVGTKAGHERYAQIVYIAERASQRLEEYSARHGARGEDGRTARRARRE